MNKRVHEIAKERGLSAKNVLEQLRAAGVNVKAASSSVDEAVASRVLGNGGGPAASARTAATATDPAPATTNRPARAADPAADPRNQVRSRDRDPSEGAPQAAADDDGGDQIGARRR
jgi:hypothetical protein